MSVRIPVRRLQKICNPFESSPWDTPLSIHDIECAIKTKRFVEPNDVGGAYDHAGRIAYLVKSGWDDPIEVDVGVPILNYYTDWVIQDGNHRFAAALYRKSRYISASVAGQLDYARDLFGVDCDEPMEEPRKMTGEGG